jgi:hypothetical protein
MTDDDATVIRGSDQHVSGTVPANQVYYLDVGQGDWQGRFTFRVIDWQAYRRVHMGPVDRFLSLWLIGATSLLGASTITSTLRQVESAAPGIRVGNHVRIHRFGITLYLLHETYTLGDDGSSVAVDAFERFGPVPFLFQNHKQHTAEVSDGGMRAVYTLPLLGSEWTATYEVQPDRRHIDSTLSCAWAEAHEIIHKVSA